MMGYLDPTEYEAYGLTAETTDDWITTASALMDGYCRRPTLFATSYTERMRLQDGRRTARLSYLPLTAVAPANSPLVSVRARLGNARERGMVDSFREELIRAFSAPGSWTELDATSADFDPETGEVTLPVNFLGFPYSEVEVVYTAGFAIIPPALKVACAQIVRNAQATPALNVRSSKVDTLQLQYFSGSLLDEQVVSLLRPYVARKMG